MLAIAAVSTHVMPYLSSVRISRRVAGLVAGGIPIVSIPGRLGFGFLADRYDKRYVTAATAVMMCAGLVCFEYVAPGSAWLIVPFLVLYGAGFGAGRIMIPSLVREYFGVHSFATILGLMNGVMSLAAIIGSPLAGRL